MMRTPGPISAMLHPHARRAVLHAGAGGAQRGAGDLGAIFRYEYKGYLPRHG